MEAPHGDHLSWLIRIPGVFAEHAERIVASVGGRISKPLGGEYWMVRAVAPPSANTGFIRWNLPVEHAWPCNPREMPGFVEKAAQAIFREFGSRNPQALMAGPLDPSSPDRYYKSLASNLRGRALQLFPKEIAEIEGAENQHACRPTLFCLVGRSGLFCGMRSPRDANGFYPGGTRYIRQSSPSAVSRAGAKIAEALHYLRLHRDVPAPGCHWLELGASPGGMTAELLARHYQVTAVDRAPLDPRVAGQPGLRFLRQGAADFQPDSGAHFDAILSDMNGSPRGSIREICRLSPALVPGGLAVFTLKMAGAETLAEMSGMLRETLATAGAAGLCPLAVTHLTYNRRELTVLESPRLTRATP